MTARMTDFTQTLRLAVVLVTVATTAESWLVAATERRPHVVLILTDNHGARTLGCYGNKDIRTPHIDQLAREGTRYTRAFASNPVCSPTRATLLTGLLPLLPSFPREPTHPWQYNNRDYINDLWKGVGSQTVIFDGIDEELAQVQVVEPPPLEDGFRRAEIQVPDGFSVELAAGPPLVQHPMMACFDDRGRLYIAESAGLNLGANDLEKQLPNYIRMLEDRDGDGRFDRSTVFADQLTLPQGALWHDGALYVASPPNIWRLTDTDDDGIADQREVIVNQFGYTGNAASIHGCFLGPNGRIYWCDGRHGHELRDQAGKVTSKREGSYIFSCRPDGGDVQIHCGGGMDNPVEIDFKEIVRRALGDSSTSVRLAACSSVFTNADSQAAESLIAMLGDEDPFIRRVAAKTLGRLRSDLAVPSLLAAFTRQMDRSEEHALLYALIEIDNPDSTVAGLSSPSPNVRRAALIALDQMENGRLSPQVVASLLTRGDHRLRMAARDVFRGRPDWSDEAPRLLNDLLSDPEFASEDSALVQPLITTFLDETKVARLVGDSLARDDLAPASRLLLLESIADGNSLDLHESWVSPLERALQSNEPNLQEAAIRAAASIKTDRFDKTLRNIAGNVTRPALVRIAALDAMVVKNRRMSDTTFRTLQEMLGPRATSQARGRAAQLLAATPLSDSQLIALAAELKTAGVLELRQLIRPFQRSRNRLVGRAFLESIEQAPALLSFDIPWRYGDVALLDNYVAMHGRRTFAGTGKVLAALVSSQA